MRLLQLLILAVPTAADRGSIFRAYTTPRTRRYRQVVVGCVAGGRGIAARSTASAHRSTPSGATTIAAALSRLPIHPFALDRE
jgi:hypothetical protein